MPVICPRCHRYHAIGIVTGTVGCRWRRFQHSYHQSSRCDMFWLCFLFVTSVYVWFWFYYWLLAANSADNINGYTFEQLKTWVPAHLIAFVLTCITLAYIIILNVFMLVHFFLGCQLYVHWVHRAVLVAILCFSVIVTILTDHVWSDGWQLMKLSLMITAPFLQISAVIVMTFVSLFLARLFLNYRHENVRIFLAVRVSFMTLYVGLMLALYLSPLGIKSPCLVRSEDLPAKPLLIAHKGASAIAPENTLVAFEYAADNNVLAFESDVSISLDGVPFILHDASLRRTTNIDTIFPDKVDQAACFLNMSEIKQLEAGSWFLRDDPWGTVGSLTNEQRSLFSSQEIPTLVEMLELAMKRNVSVMFDIKPIDSKYLCKGHPFYDRFGQIIVETINNLGFPNDKLWWLYYEDVNVSTSFRRINANASMPIANLSESGVTTVNFDYDAIAWSRNIMEYIRNNIWVNIYVIDSSWLFSLCWCFGVASITTNKCHMFTNIDRPVWHLTPQEYLGLWITVDIISAICIVFFWLLQRRRTVRRLNIDIDSVSLQLAASDTDLYSSARRRHHLIAPDNIGAIGTVTSDY